MDLQRLIKSAPNITDNDSHEIFGIIGGARSLVTASLFKKINKTILLITSDAQEIADELKYYIGSENVCFFPSWDTFPTEDISPSKEIIGERLSILDKLMTGKKMIVTATIKSAITSTISPEELKRNKIVLQKGKDMDREIFIKNLVMIGYKRRDVVGERGEFAARGGILDIFPSNLENPVRIELLGNSIESIKPFDTSNQRSFAHIDKVSILPIHEIILNDEEEYKDGIELLIPQRYPEFTCLTDHLQKDQMIILDDPSNLELSSQQFIKEVEELRQSVKGKYYLTYEELMGKTGHLNIQKYLPGENIFRHGRNFHGNIASLAEEIDTLKNDHIVVIASKQADRLYELMQDNGTFSMKVESIPENITNGIYIMYGELYEGFISDNIAVFTDREIFGKIPSRIKFIKKPNEGIGKDILIDLKIGDYVVHETYGIGIYKGMTQITVAGALQEYIEIDYADEDKLYVPPHHMGLVEKYSGAGEHAPKISKMGSSDWAKTKAKAKKSIKDITEELISIYASRQREEGYTYPPDNMWQMELEKTFPYEETPDQEKTIRQLKHDMERGKLIDRLVCGDVGYGKTEVALRIAFKTMSAGKQVAILTPTTVLADQHFRTFSARFDSYPVNVEMLSRFRTKEEQKNVIKGLSDGSVDMVVGTHRLLSKDIKFKDLGLIIVDEEQKFGVTHKEKLKLLSHGVNIITLSATPIPRTLYMSLSGIKEMSVIATPPLDRSPVRTYLRPWDENTIKEVLLRELERGGQVFFVHNQVKTIDKIAATIQRLVPKARITVGHGQMDEQDLEKVMIGFINKDYDILVSTSIIESGLDIPTVNTVVIDHAENFGLSQLYQIRGRVGRSSTRAFAYLLYHKEKILTEQALDRLKAVQEFTALGSGYKLAMADLEIRGSGNMLGSQQSGHMLNIGFDMYCDMLEESVREIKNIDLPTSKKVYIDIKVDAYIPSEHISDDKQRIAVYKRLNIINTIEELNDIKQELTDRYGKPPKQLVTLFNVITIKLHAGLKDITSIVANTDNIEVRYGKNKVIREKPKQPGQQNLLNEIERVIRLTRNS